MSVGRTILFKFYGEALQGKIKSVSLRGASSIPASRNGTLTGIVFPGTDVTFTAAADATIKIQPCVTSTRSFTVAASTFAGVQTVNIYGGIFIAGDSNYPYAIAESLAAGSMTSKVNFFASGSQTGNSA